MFFQCLVTFAVGFIMGWIMRTKKYQEKGE